MYSSFSRSSRFPLPRCAAIALVTLAWSSAALCGDIYTAAESGDLVQVKALIKADPALVFRTNDIGDTPLHKAAIGGNKDIVALLLANKADVNAKTPNGLTPLHIAALNGRTDVVAMLLANKADVNAKTTNGMTPLDEAVARSHKDVAALLLQHGGRESAPPGSASNPIKDNGNDTLTDTRTGLTWAGHDYTAPMTWGGAAAHCRNLSLAGHSDWGLATKDQLVTLWTDGGERNAYSTYYWSSEIDPTTRINGDLAWNVDFKDGSISHAPVSESNTDFLGFPLCVRQRK